MLRVNNQVWGKKFSSQKISLSHTHRWISIKNSILKFYYKYEHDTVPEYFKSTNFITKPSHEYSTRQRGPLRNPLAHTSCAQQSLRFNLSNLIRSTPEQTLEKIYTHSLQGFNWYIKRTTIANYQLECSIPECYICNL